MPDQKITTTIYPPCDHPYTQTYTSGSLSFSAGEVIDTLEEHLVCLCCGMELDQEYAQAQAEYAQDQED